MSREDASLVIGLLANSVFIAQFAFLGLLVLFVAGIAAGKNKTVKQIFSLVSSNALILAFFISLFATAGSLFLSEIAHFVPCKLCWFQRIFMYPQVLILGIAAVKNDLSVKKYILPMSVIGAAIAVYHYILQMSPIPLPCTDEIASCTAKQFAHYGYITIPFMSFVAFALIIALMLFVKRAK